MSFDPATTVGRVKELVWNAWPSGESVYCLSFIRAIFLSSSEVMLS